MLWPKKEEVTGDWKKLHNEELYNLYSPNITRVIKSRMEFGGAYGGSRREERCIQGYCGETWQKQTTWKTQAWIGRKYSNRSEKKWDGETWTGLIWLRRGRGGGRF
jgi:hypothetical protein